MRVQFRNTITGRVETYDHLNREQATALVTFARTLGEPEMVELRVRVPGLDRHSEATWADVTGQF